MNERIQELAEQAGIQVDYFGLGSCDDGGNPDIEKFALLIVQECVAQCEKIRNDAQFVIQNGDYLTESGRMLHEGAWGGAANCAHAIQQHFGVES